MIIGIVGQRAEGEINDKRGEKNPVEKTVADETTAQRRIPVSRFVGTRDCNALGWNLSPLLPRPPFRTVGLFVGVQNGAFSILSGDGQICQRISIPLRTISLSTMPSLALKAQVLTA